MIHTHFNGFANVMINTAIEKVSTVVNLSKCSLREKPRPL